MRNLILLYLLMSLIGCGKSKFNPEWLKEKAPEKFYARFETTKGDFEIEVKRSLSPQAADRLFQLINHGYFDNAFFYRVVPGFVAQFGSLDTLNRKQWESFKIPDERVKYSNKKGTISFARLGKNSRGLELFINLSDNTVLDTLHFEGVKGFPALGNVINGMETVQKLYSGYGEATMSDENIYSNKDLFYTTYPKLDIIHKAYLIKVN